MKYFTPELHGRTASLDDAVADAAHAEWERALALYDRHLERIRPAFTPGLKKLTGELRLHDSRLMFLGQTGDRCFMVLQPERSPQAAVWLEYALAGSPLVQVNTLPESLRTSDCFFLYDEVDANLHKGERVFGHSILFTNGLCVRIRFRDVKIRVADQLALVAPTADTAGLSQPA